MSTLTAVERQAAPASTPRGALAGVLIYLAVVSTAVASVGAPLLPTIVASYHVSLGASQWALTTTLVMGALATPVLGRLGDGRHRRSTTLATAGAVTVGCALSALPIGFAMLLVGRVLQGVGLALIPLATAYARESLPGELSRRTIVAVGITTAVGVGVGYPLAGLLTQYLGLWAPFAVGAMLSLAGLLAAAALLPPSPGRESPADLTGTVLLAASVVALLLAVAQGFAWGWTSPVVLSSAAVGVLAAATWVAWELRSRTPLVDLRLLRRRSVLAGNLTGLLVALGFYPLMSLVVRYVQTPPSAGYGFGASGLVAGVMLTPFSVASFAARRPALALARRTSPDWVVAAASLVLIAGQGLFLVDRSGYLEVVSSMALTGLGVGAVFAVNPIQIIDGVPADQTSSSISFYQLIRTVGYAVASALSATVLVGFTASAGGYPSAAGYSTAAVVDIGLLGCALIAALVLATRQTTPPRSLSVLKRTQRGFDEARISESTANLDTVRETPAGAWGEPDRPERWWMSSGQPLGH